MKRHHKSFSVTLVLKNILHLQTSVSTPTVRKTKVYLCFRMNDESKKPPLLMKLAELSRRWKPVLLFLQVKLLLFLCSNDTSTSSLLKENVKAIQVAALVIQYCFDMHTAIREVIFQ